MEMEVRGNAFVRFLPMSKSANLVGSSLEIDPFQCDII